MSVLHKVNLTFNALRYIFFYFDEHLKLELKYNIRYSSIIKFLINYKLIDYDKYIAYSKSMSEKMVHENQYHQATLYINIS